MAIVNNNDWERVQPKLNIEYGAALSKGLIPNWSPVVKFGENLDIDSGVEETIWSQGGLWQPITTAYQLNIVSTSTADVNTTGTGAWLVYIFGLDSDYNPIEEIVNLNGTVTVTSTLSYLYINRVAVGYSGSGRKNAGTISLTQQTSGLKLAEIPIGKSITQKTPYTVPAGYTAYLSGVLINVVKEAGGQSPLVEFRFLSYSPVSKTTYEVANVFINCANSNSLQIDQPFALPTEEKHTFFINAISDQNNVRVFCRYYMSLIKNRV